MDVTPQNEHLCDTEQLESLLEYLDAEGDRMANDIRGGVYRDVLIGEVSSVNNVARMKHCWPTMPGAVERMPHGTPYIGVAESRAIFASESHSEWCEHERKIQEMLVTLRKGEALPGKVVMWLQTCPSTAWVIIIGNHTTAATYRYAVETGGALVLPVYRVIKRGHPLQTLRG